MTASLSRVIDLKKLRDEETYRDGVIRKGIEPSVIHDVLHYEEVVVSYCKKLKSYAHSKMLLRRR